MATIVNTPANSNDNSMMSLISVILVLAVVGLVIYMAAPILTGAFRGPSVTVPDQIDVNVNTPNQGGQPAQPSQ